MNRSRAWRRAQKARQVTRVADWLRHHWCGLPDPLLWDKARRRASARQCCSCFMCGNPRRAFGDHTIQERRAALLAE